MEVKNDIAMISAPLKIEDGKQAKLDLSFEAGLITFKGMLDGTTPVPDNNGTWELVDSNGQWITTKYGPEVSFFANAGVYKIFLSVGTAKVGQDVTFTAGKIENVAVIVGAGKIDVSAVFAPGGPSVLDGATIELRKGEAGLDGQHEWITTTYGKGAAFDAPAGKYRVVAIQHYATGFADVEVKAGQVTKAEVNVNGGFLAVTSQAGATMEVYSSEKDISGNRQYIATEFEGQINKAFNAGVLHVIAKAPDGTVIGEKDFEVKAGQRTEGTIP